MTVGGSLALIGAMFAIAIVPGPSDFLVVGRSLAAGFGHGAAVALGVMLADGVFILAALTSLGIAAEVMGDTFVVIKYACGLFLVGFGVVTWRSRDRQAGPGAEQVVGSWSASLASGLLITLGDPKAILFYMALLPAFVDMASVSWRDVLIVIAAATFTIATVKLAYACSAGRANALLTGGRASAVVNTAAGGVLTATGAYLLLFAR